MIPYSSFFKKRKNLDFFLSINITYYYILTFLKKLTAFALTKKLLKTNKKLDCF